MPLSPQEKELFERLKSEASKRGLALPSQEPSAPVAQLESDAQLQSAVDEAGMSQSQYAVLFGAPLVIAIAAFLIYRMKSKLDITRPKNTPGPADFSMASLGVKRLSFVLSALVATGPVVVATLTLDEAHDPNFTIGVLLVGLMASALTWFAVRVIDWVVRGFKFGS